MAAEITVERDAGVATITLDAPDRRNALTRDMARELVEPPARRWTPTLRWAPWWSRAPAASSAPAATATRWPTAGRDPAEPEAYSGLGDVYRSFARVGELEPPTVAAIRGGAVGAGMNLAFATDLRVVAREAKLISGFLPIGLHPGGGHGVAARPHRPARGGRRDDALRRAHRRRPCRRAGPGLGGASTTARWSPQRAELAAVPGGRPRAGAPHRALAARRAGPARRCPGRPRWRWSAPRRCGRCAARTSPVARAPNLPLVPYFSAVRLFSSSSSRCSHR